MESPRLTTKVEYGTFQIEEMGYLQSGRASRQLLPEKSENNAAAIAAAHFLPVAIIELCSLGVRACVCARSRRAGERAMEEACFYLSPSSHILHKT